MGLGRGLAAGFLVFLVLDAQQDDGSLRVRLDVSNVHFGGPGEATVNVTLEGTNRCIEWNRTLTIDADKTGASIHSNGTQQDVWRLEPISLTFQTQRSNSDPTIFRVAQTLPIKVISEVQRNETTTASVSWRLSTITGENCPRDWHILTSNVLAITVAGAGEERARQDPEGGEAPISNATRIQNSPVEWAIGIPAAAGVLAFAWWAARKRD